MDLSVYTISGKKEAVEAAYTNNRKLIAIRWLYISVLTIVASVVSIIATHSLEYAVKYGAILISSFFVNAVLFVIAKNWRTVYSVQRAVTISQLTLDLVIAGIVTYIQGGLEARTTITYMFPILATGLLFSVAMVRWVALFCGIVYATTIISYDAFTKSSINWQELTVPLVFYPVIFILLAQIATYLIRLSSLETREKAYDSYLSLLAHQLKHPASAASMIIDTIIHGPQPLNPTTKHYVDMLQGENENLVRMIDNLLASEVVRKPQLRDETINLVELVSRMATKAARTNDRLGDLHASDVNSSAITLQGDSIRLSLALLNVFDNAFRYSPEGSKVEYELHVQTDTAYVIVRDHGSGIDKHLFKNLYKKYTPHLGNDQSVHLGGVGVGLYVAKEILRAHTGTMKIESSKDEGTSVIISLKGVTAHE